MLLWFALLKKSLENIFGDASQADHNHFAVPEEKTCWRKDLLDVKRGLNPYLRGASICDLFSVSASVWMGSWRGRVVVTARL